MIAIEAEHPGAASARAAAEGHASPPAAAAPRTLTRSSAISQQSVELSTPPAAASDPLHRSQLSARSASECGGGGGAGRRAVPLRRTKNASIESTISLPNQKSLDKRRGGGGGGAGAGLRHQHAVQTTSDVTLPTQPSITDDRKALRDALYQGIFSRHRRTIFAVGSFLRMLRSKNSNYDSIRSDSDEI